MCVILREGGCEAGQERRLSQKMLDDIYPGLYHYQLQLAALGQAELAVGASVLNDRAAGRVRDVEGGAAVSTIVDAAAACAACSAAGAACAVFRTAVDTACATDSEGDQSPCAWISTWQRVFLASIAAECVY